MPSRPGSTDDPRLDHDAGGTFLSRQFGHQSSDDAQGNPQNPANAGAAYFVPDHEGDGRRGDCRNAHRKNEWSRERTLSPRHVAHWSAANEEGGRKRCHHEPEREPCPVHRASGERIDRAFRIRSAGFRTASPGWKAKAARKAGTGLPSSSIWAAGGNMKATVTDGIPVPVYHAEPTLARFHASDAFFRGVLREIRRLLRRGHVPHPPPEGVHGAQAVAVGDHPQHLRRTEDDHHQDMDGLVWGGNENLLRAPHHGPHQHAASGRDGCTGRARLHQP